MMVQPKKLHITIRPDESGGFYALVRELPGCGSQGETLEETAANVADAIRAVLEVTSWTA